MGDAEAIRDSESEQEDQTPHALGVGWGTVAFRSVVPIAAIALLVGFFLPWVSVAIASFTGFDLALGRVVVTGASFQLPYAAPVLWLVPALAIIAIVLSSPRAVSFAAQAAVAVLSVMILGFLLQILSEINSLSNPLVQVGTGVGLGLSIVGAVCMLCGAIVGLRFRTIGLQEAGDGWTRSSLIAATLEDPWQAQVARSKWQTRDFLVAAALAVPLGLVWSLGWGHVWTASRSLLPELGFFVEGFYFTGALLVGYVLRRPGAAFLGEMIAALVELPLTPFGPVVLLLGFVQGIGAEVVFAATRYRNFSLAVMLAAGAVSALIGWWAYDYWAYGYAQLAVGTMLIRFAVKLLGGAILGGLVSKLLGDTLARTGVLNNFQIARDRVREI